MNGRQLLALLNQPRTDRAAANDNQIDAARPDIPTLKKNRRRHRTKPPTTAAIMPRATAKQAIEP
jgi:hypothetical protein